MKAVRTGALGLSLLGIAYMPASAEQGIEVVGGMVVDFLRKNKCSADYDRILAGLAAKIPQLDDEYLDEILMTVGLDGSIGVREDDDVVTYFSSECGNLSDADLPRLIAAMAKHGCTMTEDDAERFLPNAGLSEEQVGFLVEMLVMADRAALSESQRRFTIFPPYCVAK